MVGFNEGVITVLGDASVMQIVQLAPGTEVIDVSGHHVYPGPFAAHTQLGLTETQSVRATNDMNEIGSFNPEVRAAVAVNPSSRGPSPSAPSPAAPREQQNAVDAVDKSLH